MDTAGPLDSMSSRHRQVIVHVHPDIGMLDGIQDLAREFKIYKEQAFQYAEEEGMDAEEFLPALSKPDQEAFPPGHYLFLITHDPQPASRADMASEGLPRLHAPIQPTCS